MKTRSDARIPILALAVTLLVPPLLAALGVDRLKTAVRADAVGDLEVLVDTVSAGIEAWALSKKAAVVQIAGQPRVKALADVLLTSDRQSPRHTTAQAELRADLHPIMKATKLDGYFIIRRDGTTLASSRDANIGTPNVILEDTGTFARLAAGETVVSRPQQSDVPLDRGGVLVARAMTVFIGTPVLKRDGQVEAVLTFRINPSLEFFPILERARLGHSGETYLVGPKGRMLSPSRFGAVSMTMVEVGEGQPTQMAKEVMQGRDGQQLEPYADYRGVPVLGVWRRSRAVELSIASEIDASEANAPVHRGAVALWSAAALLDLLILTFGLLISRGRRRERKALLEFQAIVDLAPTAIVVAAAEGQITVANAAFARLVDLRVEHIVGKTLWRVAPEGLAPRAEARHEEAMASFGALVSEGRAQTKHGERVFQIVSSSLPDDQNRSYATCTVWTDVTERNAAVTELQEFNRLLEQRVAERTREAEAAGQAKAEFLARMSHELRTPLNGIQGLLTLALREALDEQPRVLLSRARASADWLRTIVDEVLDFSRLEAGRLELDRLEFRLEQVFEGLADVVAARPTACDVAFLLRVADDAPHALIGDVVRIRQVLLNLVGNAAKFTEVGQISVDVTVESTSANGVMLRFTVEDTGIGIKPEDGLRLFEPFTQADGSVTRRFGGSGLGLSICHHLVGLMDGDISATGTPGVGAQFTFTAGLLRAEPNSTKQRWDQIERALVVDDDHLALVMLCEQLIGLGVAADGARSGAEALECLDTAHALGAPYNLVLLDLAMEGMDGLQTAEAIWAQPGPQPACVMVSANGRTALDGRPSADALDGFINKPVTRRTLRSLLDTLTGSAQVSLGPKCVLTFPGARVLVVEDNETNQIVARGLLDSYGLSVEVVGGGEQAIERVKHGAFDLVFMDIHMPGIGGLEATRQIRALLGQTPPIVAMTAEVLPAARAAAKAAGMNDYLTKPLE